MSYTRNPAWQDGVGLTLITAATLNHLEDGLVDAAGDADTANTGLSGKAATVHTHTASSVTDFPEAVDDRVAALLKAGANVTLTYDDTAGTLTIAAAAGGGGGAAVGPGPAWWVGHAIALMQPNAPQRAVDPSKGGNRLGGLPVGVSRAVTASSVSVNINVAAAGATVRVGIYRTDADGQPTTALWDSGVIDASTTGAKSVAGPLTVPAGDYWVLGTSSSSTVRFDGWWSSKYVASSGAFDAVYGFVFGSAGSALPADPLPDLTAVAVGNDNTGGAGAPMLQLLVTGLS